jgi:hypothetical protein
VLRALALAGRLAPERRPRGLRRAAAHPRSAREGRRSTMRWRKCGARPSSPRTRRCRPATTRFRSTWSRSTWRAAGARSGSTAAFPGARRARQRPGSAVQHDGARHAHGRPTSTPSAPARRGHARDVAADLARPPVDSAGQVITNGVHVPTWIAARMLVAVQRQLGANWLDRRTTRRSGIGSFDIPDEELWTCAADAARRAVHLHPRAAARSDGRRNTSSPGRIVAGGAMLDPHALTIGYARRFTAYKRPELIFHDAERLAQDPHAAEPPGADRVRRQGPSRRRSGEASPAAGLPRALDPLFAGRIAFIDDYDMHVAHYLVGGCDVWLNNPRKPLEASGTSGMKAAINGVPHLSIGDGWWAEGYNGRNGWLIESQAIRTIRRRDRRGRRRVALPLLESTRSCRPSTIARPGARRRAGWRWSARRCGPACPGSRPGAC